MGVPRPRPPSRRLPALRLGRSVPNNRHVAQMRFRATIGKSGRIVLPAELRRATGIEVGDAVILRADDHSIRIVRPADALAEVQAAVRRVIPVDRQLSQELIAERHAEAARE